MSIKAVEAASTMHSQSTTQKKAKISVKDDLYIVAPTTSFLFAAPLIVVRHQFDIDNNLMFDS